MATATESKKKRTKNKKGNKFPSALAGALTAALDAANPNGVDVFDEWTEYLTDRKQPLSLRKLLGTKLSDPLLWAVEPGTRSNLQLRPLLEAPTKSKGKHGFATDSNRVLSAMEAWLAKNHQQDSAMTALDANAWCHFLPQAIVALPRSAWIAMLERLVDVAQAGAGNAAGESPWPRQLTRVELPIALAYQFPEIERCRVLGAPAAERMSENIGELLDGQGMLHANNLEWLQLLMACWTRCLAMLNHLKGVKINKAAREEYNWMVRHVLRTMRIDGGMPFTAWQPSNDADRFSEAFRAAIQLADDEEDKALAKHVIKGRDIPDSRLPEEPGYHSEWAELAFLQPDWDPKAPRMTVDFSQFATPTELSNLGTVLWSTTFAPEIKINGARVQPHDDEWEVVCWFSDVDVDFLEIESGLPGGWNLQRQFLMARQDHFLYISDNLVGPGPANIDYQLTLPLAGGVSLKDNDESREMLIRGKRALALVVPLALPEWRSDPRGGDLYADGGSLVLQQIAKGSALCAPLFIDLHRRRMQKPMTWRQLTVADNLEVVSRDTAVGFRVHVGPEQWMIYRALGSKGNRTLIGQNTSSEFICSRLLSDGDVEELVEIE